MLAIGRHKAADIIGCKAKNALNAILLLILKSNTTLAFEESIGGPGCAKEDARGVGGGGHGVEVLIELGRGNGLGFIHGEEEIGGGAHDFCGRVAGEELEARMAETVHIAFGGFPEATRTDTGIERTPDDEHVVGGLRFEGGGNGNNAPASMGITVEEPGEEMSLEFIFTGLARENNHKGEAAMMDDRILDGEGDLALVGAEGNTTGRGPMDGIEADGEADASSKR